MQLLKETTAIQRERRDVARNLRRARLLKGLSQEALAMAIRERLEDSHVSREHVANWEAGRGKPNAAHREALAQELDVPLDYFFRRDALAGGGH